MSKELDRVAFIGLGVMGYPMAGHLAKSGTAVTVFNRTTAKAEQWLSEFAGDGECAVEGEAGVGRGRQNRLPLTVSIPPTLRNLLTRLHEWASAA